jgi:fatty-acid desaturase
MLKVMLLSKTSLLRCFHIFNHLAFFAGIGHYGWSPLWISVLFWFLYGCLGISIGFHRLLSHKAFEAHPLGYYVTSVLGSLATGGSPISWVGAHRLHHTYPDQPQDPHSLKNQSFLHIYLHLWSPFLIKRKHIRELVKDPFQVFLHRYYFHLLLLFAATLYLISPYVGIFCYSVPAVMAFHAFGMINTFGHGHGYRTYPTEDSSSNSWVANLLTWGEGWHNNHHKYPNKYRIGLRHFEIDISAWVIENIPFVATDRFRNKLKFSHRRGS